MLAAVLKASAEMVSVAIRAVFAQAAKQQVAEQFDTIAAMLGRQFPKVEQLMTEAKDDLLAFIAFPVSHWKKIWSTDERVNPGWVDGPLFGRVRVAA
jgi:putative transposase